MQPNAAAPAEPPVSRERELLQEVKQLVGSHTFDHWFEKAASIEITEDGVTIGVENPFLLSWMQNRLRPAVAEAARRVLGEAVQVRFKTRPVPAKSDLAKSGKQPAPNESLLCRAEKAAPAIAATRGAIAATRGTTGVTRPLHPFKTVRLGNVIPARLSCSVRRAVPPPRPHRGDRSRAPLFRRGTDAPNTTPAGVYQRPSPQQPSSQQDRRRFADLADFVKGPCNELAMTAAVQVSDQPGSRYNPLVLYGGVGTGKTHLLEAAYRRLRARASRFARASLSAEGFANHFTQALRERSLPSFRQRFRSVDVLIVDDVDFLDGKRVIQEEFLHTIKQLESHDRQILLSADRHPRLLTKLSEELVTRFIAGIVCRLDPPTWRPAGRLWCGRRPAYPKVSTSLDSIGAQRSHERSRAGGGSRLP